jgi:hypothetical protein
MRYRLDDDILSALQPELTSQIAALARRDLRRSDQLRAEKKTETDHSLAPTDRIERPDEKATERFTRSDVGKSTGTSTKKPTDSFTLSPTTVQRALGSLPAQILDGDSGEITAEVRAVPFRDHLERVIKIQCFLPIGHFLKRDGARIDIRIDGARYRIKDGFYVKPRPGDDGQWSYLAYVG